MSEVKLGKNGKPFNPTLGGAFTNDAFGEGSLKFDITAENFDTLMKNVQIGSSILFKFNKVTSKGNKHYFTELLPPFIRATPPVAKSEGGLD